MALSRRLRAVVEPTPRHAAARARRHAPGEALHTAARVVLDAAAALGVACALAVVGLLLSGWRPVVLVSGSMAPAMPTGTLVLTRPVPVAEVRVGDVVTVPVPGGDARVTHRVTGLTPEGGTTWASLRGDANDADDGVAYPLGGTVLRAAASVPGVGRLVTGTPATVLATGAAALVVVALLPARPADRGGTTGYSPNRRATARSWSPDRRSPASSSVDSGTCSRSPTPDRPTIDGTDRQTSLMPW